MSDFEEFVKNSYENASINQKLYKLRKEEQALLRLNSRLYREAGGIVYDKVNPAASTAGILHMLETGATVEETLEFLEEHFNKPEGWSLKTKNKPLTNSERGKNVKHLREVQEENPREVLKRLLESGLTTYKEIKEPETYNKQLKYLHKVSNLQKKLDTLESELTELKDSLEMYKASQNVAMSNVNRRLVGLEMLNGVVTDLQYDGSEEHDRILIETLTEAVDERLKLEWLLGMGIPKMKIAQLMGFTERTLRRKVIAYDLKRT
jgi:molybdopterin converting factor small subunit